MNRTRDSLIRANAQASDIRQLVRHKNSFLFTDERLRVLELNGISSWQQRDVNVSPAFLQALGTALCRSFGGQTEIEMNATGFTMHVRSPFQIQKGTPSPGICISLADVRAHLDTEDAESALAHKLALHANEAALKFISTLLQLLTSFEHLIDHTDDALIWRSTGRRPIRTSLLPPVPSRK